MARIHCKTGIALLLSAVAFLPLSANAERVTLVCPNAISQRIILTFILDTEKNIVLSARFQSLTLDDIIFGNLPLTSNDAEFSWKWTYKQRQTNYYTLDRNTLELKTRSDLEHCRRSALALPTEATPTLKRVSILLRRWRHPEVDSDLQIQRPR
jgi:hypothetical protein